MDLCDISQIRSLLSRHGFRFSHAKGQNFLKERWVVEDIARLAGVNETTGVLEIGPGIGPLTEQLCLRAGKVAAVEVDRSLQPILAETLGSYGNLELIWGDVMKMDIRALCSEQFAGLTPVACANLPYYITTPVLTALLEADCFASVTVMVQKEVAQRICARAGSPDYGSFTAFCAYYADAQMLFEVPASCFVPAPKVTSAVLTLRRRGAPPAAVSEPALYFRTVRAAFGQRRKTLLNALSSGFQELGKPVLENCIRKCGFDPAIRGEMLRPEDFCLLSCAIAEEKRQSHV